jgi:hypothetical protein
MSVAGLPKWLAGAQENDDPATILAASIWVRIRMPLFLRAGGGRGGDESVGQQAPGQQEIDCFPVTT